MDLTHPPSKAEVARRAPRCRERARHAWLDRRRPDPRRQGQPAPRSTTSCRRPARPRWSRTTPRRCWRSSRRGCGIGDLRRVLADGGQEWPRTRPTTRRSVARSRRPSSSPRRLRMGPLRDTVVEMELVTGDGRLVRSGARTVKSVQGYDLHRLATGSLGTLGAIVQVAVKVRPLPKARRLVRAGGGGRPAGRCSMRSRSPPPSWRRPLASRSPSRDGPRRSRNRRRRSAAPSGTWRSTRTRRSAGRRRSPAGRRRGRRSRRRGSRPSSTGRTTGAR